MQDSQSISPLSLKQNIAWNTFGCIINQACVWAITILAVLLSDGFDDAGIIAYAMAIGNMFCPLATYNMRTIQASDVNDEISTRSYVGFRIVTTILAYLVFTLYLFITSSSWMLIGATLCWLIYKADESFALVYYGVYQRSMRMDYLGKSQTMRGVLTLGAFALGLVFGFGVCWSIIAVAFSCMLVTIIYDRRHALKLTDIKPEIRFKLSVRLLLQYFPSVMSVLLYAAITSIPRQIFENAYGEDALGIYASIAIPAAIVPLVVQFLYNPLIVGMAKKWNECDISSLLRIIRKVILIIVCAISIALIFCIVCGEDILVLIYGEKIAGHQTVFFWALVATGATSTFSFLFDVLLILRRIGSALLCNAISFILVVISTFLLINQFYMNGINYALIISFLVGIIIEISMIYKAFSSVRSSYGIKE